MRSVRIDDRDGADIVERLEWGKIAPLDERTESETSHRVMISPLAVELVDPNDIEATVYVLDAGSVICRLS